MSDHLVVRVDGFVKPAHEMKAYGSVDEKQQHQMVGPSSSTAPVPGQEVVMTVEGEENEGVPLISMAECRICQEEDSLANLEASCACRGSLKASQILQIFTFYSTQLLGPNYHCREGSKLALLPLPDSALEVVLINFPRGVFYGCGDLIFSSHTIFSLVFVRMYQKYGTRSYQPLQWP